MQEILDRLTHLEKMISKQKSPWRSVSESASYMKISERQIRKYLAQGKIRNKRIGDPQKGRILIHQKWLDAFIMGYGTRMTPFQLSQLNKIQTNTKGK
jgi:hypothetical protein